MLPHLYNGKTCFLSDNDNPRRLKHKVGGSQDFGRSRDVEDGLLAVGRRIDEGDHLKSIRHCRLDCDHTGSHLYPRHLPKVVNSHRGLHPQHQQSQEQRPRVSFLILLQRACRLRQERPAVHHSLATKRRNPYFDLLRLVVFTHTMGHIWIWRPLRHD